MYKRRPAEDRPMGRGGEKMGTSVIMRLLVLGMAVVLVRGIDLAVHRSWIGPGVVGVMIPALSTMSLCTQPGESPSDNGVAATSATNPAIIHTAAYALALSASMAHRSRRGGHLSTDNNIPAVKSNHFTTLSDHHNSYLDRVYQAWRYPLTVRSGRCDQRLYCRAQQGSRGCV